MTGVELHGISKRFKQTPALRDVSFAVAAGEVLALTGPSGAGKTTLCRVVAGLEAPDHGHCRIAGADVGDVPPGRRRVAFMFESYALYPHLTVRRNVASPLTAPNGDRRDAAAVNALIDETLTLLGIRELAERLPAELSGGQKQRAALARTLVQDPSVTLLDEPISHLDAKLRHRLRGELKRLLASRAAPTIWVTPDAMEALSVGDRVAVIDRGTIEQIGTPEEVWLRPASVRVARLLGDPPMNLIPGRLHKAPDGTVAFRHGQWLVALPRGIAAMARGLGPDFECILGIRPDALAVAPPGAAAGAAVEVYSHESFGKHVVVTVRLGALLLKVKTRRDADVAIDAAAALIPRAGGMALFDGTTGAALAWSQESTESAKTTAEA
jgi:multiple sugar transport system ATP-binding protein